MAKRSKDGGVSDVNNANAQVDLDEVLTTRRLLQVLQDFGVPTTALTYPSPTLSRQMPASYDATSQGYREMTFDPQLAQINSGGTITVAGTIHAVRIDCWGGRSFSNVTVGCAVVGSGMTSNQCFASIIDSTSGKELSRSADISGSWGSTGAVTIPLLTTVQPSRGQRLLVALLLNSSGTMPTLRTGAAGVTMSNIGLTATSPLRFGALGTSQTSMPTSFTMSSFTTTGGIYFWAGLS